MDIAVQRHGKNYRESYQKKKEKNVGVKDFEFFWN
jgi:hypothetical protein